MLSNKTHRGRFAPSPTGRMHLGNVMAALLSWLSVKSKGGVWVLRHEDLDPERSRPEYAKQIEDDLRWLGLTWDEGGLDNMGNYGPYLQSERREVYNQMLRKLNDEQLLYPCFCTRADRLAASAPHADDPKPQPCRCYGLTEQEKSELGKERKASLKCRLTETAVNCFVDDHYGLFQDSEPLRDPVVQRADGAFAYQLAVVADDAAMKITEVVRGCDLLSSTPLQIAMYAMLGLQVPTFSHHPLLCAADGRRLCKRDVAMHLGELRKHHSANEVIGMVAHALGLTPEATPITPNELLPLFSWSKIPTKNIIL